MAVVTLTEVWPVAAALFAGIGLFLGVPAWRLARRQYDVEVKAQQNQELARAIKQVLSGDDATVPTSPDNPSVVDLLSDIRECMREQSWLTLMFAHHMADGHGGQMPHDLGR